MILLQSLHIFLVLGDAAEDIFLILLCADQKTVLVRCLVAKHQNQQLYDQHAAQQTAYDQQGRHDAAQHQGSDHDVCPNGLVEVEEGQTIRLFLRAKCENGYRLESDLFSGVVQEEGPNGFAETADYFVPNYCVYDEDGNLEFRTSYEEGDYFYDEIGSVLKIKQYQNAKRELLEALETYYRIVFLGEGLDEEE